MGKPEENHRMNEQITTALLVGCVVPVGPCVDDGARVSFATAVMGIPAASSFSLVVGCCA